MFSAEESSRNMTSKTSNFDYLALKNEGNALYSAGDFLGAVQKYSKALKLCTDNNADRSALLKNRAVAYLNIQEYQKVIDDSTAALEITPGDIKALYRRCQAYERLEKYNEALEDARAVICLNPQNNAIQPYLRRLQEIDSESNEKALNINSMPDEMLIEIFGFLSHNQLGQIARVCQKWNILTKDPVLWKKVNAHFLSSDPHLQATARESFINQLPPYVTCLRLKFDGYFFDTEPLSFEAISVQLKEKCPQLQMLELWCIKLADTLPSIINFCTQLQKNVRILLFRMCEFSKHFEKDECVDISEIEILELFRCELGRFNKPQFSRMPHLKNLRIINTYIDDYWFEDNPSFLNQLHVLDLGNTDFGSRTFQAIWNHAFNLQELHLCCSHYIHLEDLDFNNPVFSNLKTICLSNCWEVTWHDIVSIVRSCQSLQKVYIHEDVFKCFDDPSFVVGNVCMSKILKVNNKVHFHIK